GGRSSHRIRKPGAPPGGSRPGRFRQFLRPRERVLRAWNALSQPFVSSRPGGIGSAIAWTCARVFARILTLMRQQPLGFLERLYIIEVVRGLSLTARHFFANFWRHLVRAFGFKVGKGETV